MQMFLCLYLCLCGILHHCGQHMQDELGCLTDSHVYAKKTRYVQYLQNL